MLKYSLGLDISSKDIHACISVIDSVQKVTIKSTRKILNNLKGFQDLHQWITQHVKGAEVPLVATMEATGVYYENCAMYLFKHGYAVSVVLPNKAKRYLQSTGLKSKNDKIDARGLSRMGAEQCLDLWQPMEEFFYQLRSLTRHHQSTQELKTSLKNQLHAEMNGMYQNKTVVKDLKGIISKLEDQICRLEEQIKLEMNSVPEVKERVTNICSIKGVGMLTAATVLAETNGFALFKSASQLVSYAGYDVVQNESGNHIGRTRISKKGNSRIRRILFMPAFAAVTHDVKPFSDLYQRTLSKHQMKMKSYVAVQKKLLTTIFALWKRTEIFEENYASKIKIAPAKASAKQGKANEDESSQVSFGNHKNNKIIASSHLVL